MTEFAVPYGLETLKFLLPRGEGKVLEPESLPRDVSERELIQRYLQNPLGSRNLSEIASGKKSAVILIPGRARRVGAREYVTALVDELNLGGIPDHGIAVILADGTHEQHLESDLEALLGAELLSRIRCYGHDPRKEAGLTFLDTTSFGTPVHINKQVQDTEVKILTGRIVPHYFAGFSGGRKAIIPGVAGFPTILANHKLTLDGESGIHKEIRPCSLSRNPVHLDMLEGARMVKPDFCLNTLFDSKDRLVSVVAGDFEVAHEKGCQQAMEMLCMKVEKPVDVVITAAGGFPYDMNFMQSLKAVFNTQEIIRPGGSIFWIAECPGGINPGFLEWAQIESDAELGHTVYQKYALTGHNSLMLRKLIRKAEVALLSKLPSEIVKKLGLHPVTSLQEGIQWLQRKFPADFSYAVIPHANTMCVQTKK
jgi:lactate racemase